jgi:membrane associated rhomboid family serine protease
VQLADDTADSGSGLVVPPGDAVATAAANGTVKAGASPAWFGWLGTVPVVGEYRKIFHLINHFRLSSYLQCSS